MDMQKVRTSVDIDATLHKDIRIHCLQTSTTLKEWVEEAIREKYQKEYSDKERGLRNED